MNEKIASILFWSLIFISLILLAWRLFGNSPTTDLILIPLTIALIVNAWKTSGDISSLKTRLENFEKQFISLAKDFKEHLKTQNIFEEKLFSLSKKLKINSKL